MLENTIEQMDLSIPADAVELSTHDLDEVTGAWGGGFGGSCFGGFGSCFTSFSFSRQFSECINWFSFGSCFGSCFGGWN
jgi:hypothetical protein